MATLAAIVFCVFFGGAAYLMFARLNIWFPWLIVVAAQGPNDPSGGLCGRFDPTYVERQLLENLDGNLLSPRQMKEILETT